MDTFEIGKLIHTLRKNAGYTQKQLADSLFVTDKAVSKWERGICMPDSSLLSKLSALLDVDIEYLISGKKAFSNEKWLGLILIDDVEGEIAGKPLVHYLLTYFMLVGITKICIQTKNKGYIEGLHLEQFGLNVLFEMPQNNNVVVIFDKVFLYGNNLTRYIQSFIYEEDNIIPVVDGRDVPILFSHDSYLYMLSHKELCKRKSCGRGIVCLPLGPDASTFITICEKYNSKKISDLKEIATNRYLI